jgi:hypothetical protein
MRSPRQLKIVAVLALFSVSTVACEERVVRRSGVYSQQQFGGMGSTSSGGVIIVPPAEQEKPFDPLGDLWSLITSPFRDDTTPQQQTVDLRSRGGLPQRSSSSETSSEAKPAARPPAEPAPSSSSGDGPTK